MLNSAVPQLSHLAIYRKNPSSTNQFSSGLAFTNQQKELTSQSAVWSRPSAACPACTQEEVNKVMEAAKVAQKAWARTPLWKRAELLHKAAAILKEHKAPIAECLVKEIAKPAKDAISEVASR